MDDMPTPEPHAEAMPKGICDECGTHRQAGTTDYNPIQVVLGLPFGWYFGPREQVELCADCFTRVFNRGNGDTP